MTKTWVAYVALPVLGLLISLATVAVAGSPSRKEVDGPATSADLGADPGEPEAMARSSPSSSAGAKMLFRRVVAMASTDPDRAQTLARSISDLNVRSGALAHMAQVLAVMGHPNAQRVAEAAERTARLIADPSLRARALGGVARALASTDPDRAQSVARSISDAHVRTLTLARIVEGVPVATDLALLSMRQITVEEAPGFYREDDGTLVSVVGKDAFQTLKGERR